MNFTDKHKLYFNVFLLFVLTYLLTAKLLNGFKTQDFDYLRIVFYIVFIGLSIKNINKHNV